MRVIAMQNGFYGGSRRRVGDEFEINAKAPLPSWVRLAEPAAPVAKTKHQRIAEVKEHVAELRALRHHPKGK